VIAGNANVAGDVLTCSAGTWGNAPTSYTYEWYRNGAPIGSPTTTVLTSSTYTLTASDVATPAVFQCMVTGTSLSGASTRATPNKATGAAPAGPGAPTPTVPATNVSVTSSVSTTATTVDGATNVFETCTTTTDCQNGTTGAGNGQFAASAVRSIAEDDTGNIYTVEARYNTGPGTSNFRVQKFTLPGDTVTPQGVFACATLCGTNSLAGVGVKLNNNDTPLDVAVDGDGYVYVTKAFPPGTGNPPAVMTSLGMNFQQRVLKVDPDTGDVARVFLVNPGRFNKDLPSAILPVHSSYGLTGLAVGQAGLPLYVVNSEAGSIAGGTPRVFRVDDIGGLDVALSVSDVGASAATLEAAISPADIRLDTSYRFEYSRVGADDWSEFFAPAIDDPEKLGPNLGNGADGGESDSCSPNVGDRAAVCHVSQRIDGLERNREYEYRVVAATEANGLTYVSDPGQFETSPSSPSAVTGAGVWSGPPSAGPSLTFNGRVNPQGTQTSYRFEYGAEGPCSANPCESVPSSGRDVGHGVVDLDVNSTVAGLDPDVAYHYRLVATNPEGTTIGEDRVVDPAGESDRFVEMISDGDSRGLGVSENARLAVSDDGSRAFFPALSFGDQPSSPSVTTPNISTRGSAGWSVAPMSPDPAGQQVYRGVDEFAVDAGVSEVLWMERPVQGVYRWMSRGVDGGYGPVSPVLESLQRVGGEQDRFVLRGASLDQSTIVFASNSQGGGKTFFVDEPLVTGGGATRHSNLYAITGAGGGSPVLSVVNRGAGGNVIGGTCGARLGAAQSGLNGFDSESTRAVSADGSVIYFSARPSNPAACGQFDEFAHPVRIFKRVDQASTVEVTACAKTPPATCTATGDDFFSGASADGGRVFFTSPRQLVDTDTDAGAVCSDFPAGSAGCDLYMYDAGRPEGQRLTQVSAGEAVPVDHPTVGSGANVLGVVDVSMDGSRVYFVAQGRLTADATKDAANLYVFERGSEGDRVDFVARLSTRASAGQFDSPDGLLWARGKGGKSAYALPVYDGLGEGRSDGDGHLLVFTSDEKLSPVEDGDSARDLYRYDDETGELSCLTCSGDLDSQVSLANEGSGVSAAGAVQAQRVASEDGSTVVFATLEQLTPDDSNTAFDVYLWQLGEGLSLVTGVTGDAGIIGSLGRFEAGGDSGRFAVISPDGQSVFFLTRATILPQDTNNGALDWYAARVGGGFPQPTTTEECDVIAGGCNDENGGPSIDSDRDTGPSADDNAVSGARKTLSVGRLSARQLRRAARTGVLAVRVRSNEAGTVRVTARGRVGRRTRTLGSATRRLTGPGVVTVRLRLGRPAMAALQRGRRLGLAVVVRSVGARPKTVKVALRRAGK
jgi:hypothetical protein